MNRWYDNNCFAGKPAELNDFKAIKNGPWLTSTVRCYNYGDKLQDKTCVVVFVIKYEEEPSMGLGIALHQFKCTKTKIGIIIICKNTINRGHYLIHVDKIQRHKECI